MKKAVVGTEKRQLTPINAPSGVAGLRAEMVRKVAAQIRTDGLQPTAIPGLALYRSAAPTQCGHAHYEPSLCLFVQGRKRINLGEIAYISDESTFMLTTVDVPLVSQVVAATEAMPLLTTTVRLDMSLVREILMQADFAPARASRPRGIVMGKTTPELLSGALAW